MHSKSPEDLHTTGIDFRCCQMGQRVQFRKSRQHMAVHSPRVTREKNFCLNVNYVFKLQKHK